MKPPEPRSPRGEAARDGPSSPGKVGSAAGTWSLSHTPRQHPQGDIPRSLRARGVKILVFWDENLAGGISWHPPLPVAHSTPRPRRARGVTRLLRPLPRRSHGAAGIVLLLDHLARNKLEGGKEPRSVFRGTPAEGKGLSPSSSTWGSAGHGDIWGQGCEWPREVTPKLETSKSSGSLGSLLRGTKNQKLSSITPAPHWGTQTGTSCAGLGGPAGEGRGEKGKKAEGKINAPFHVAPKSLNFMPW